MIPEKTTTIEQRVFLRGYQKFEIRSDGELEVTFKRFSTHNQFKFPLWQLHPNPARLKFKPASFIIGAVFFGLFGLSLIGKMVISKNWGDVEVLIIPLIVFGIFFWACFWKLQTQSINSNVYHFRNGNGQIHIWFEKPDAKTFEAFCETLTKKAEDAWNNRPLDPSVPSLAGEISALKKLKDSGVLNDAEFDRTKSKLLEQLEEKKIGFS